MRKLIVVIYLIGSAAALMAALTGAVVGTSQSTGNEGALGNLTEGVSGSASGSSYYGVRGANSGANGVAVYGNAPAGYGVFGSTIFWRSCRFCC